MQNSNPFSNFGIENDLDQYYLENYIITQKDWFNKLVSINIQFAIKYYNDVQLLRIFKKILEYKLKFFETELNNDLEINEKRKNIEYFENYLNLNIGKIKMILLLNRFYSFDPQINIIKNKINKLNIYNSITLQRIIEDIKKLIKNRNYQYKQMEERLNILDKKRIGLLEWIYNSERSLIELIVYKKLLLNQGYNIKKRNYKQALENYAKNKGKNINEYMKNRTQIEKIKFNNFDLFTEIKKKHLKSNECAYQFKKRDENNINIIPSDFNNIDFDTFFDSLAIKNFTFLKNMEKNNLRLMNNIYNALKNLTNLYLIPINEEDSKILRVSRDIILMSISYILYNDNFNINININSPDSGRGAFGIIKMKNNKAIKYENLRMVAKKNEQKNIIIRNKRQYIKQSYVSGVQFLSYIIQKHLYNLNSYVPNIENIRFDFQKGISEITMNKVLKNEIYQYSINFKQLLNEKDKNNIFFYSKNNFYFFILKILKKLCEILIFYQNNCCFVHRDFNAGNFMINFNYDINNEFDCENFQVKLIDFTNSSIIIKNKNGNKSILSYTDYNIYRNIEIPNPYINKEWRMVDLKWLFVLIFLRYSVITGTIQIIKKIKKIFNNTDENFLNRLIKLNENKEIKKKLCRPKIAFNSYYIKNIFKQIFGYNFDEKIFDPNIFITKLDFEINKIETKKRLNIKSENTNPIKNKININLNTNFVNWNNEFYEN